MAEIMAITPCATAEMHVFMHPKIDEITPPLGVVRCVQTMKVLPVSVSILDPV